MTVCTREELARCLREAQEGRAERVILTIGRPLAAEINRERLIHALDLLLPLCQGRTQTIRRERDGSWYFNLRLHYRAGLRMVDAWTAGDMSSLSEVERIALHRAEEIVQSVDGLPPE